MQYLHWIYLCPCFSTLDIPSSNTPFCDKRHIHLCRWYWFSSRFKTRFTNIKGMWFGDFTPASTDKARLLLLHKIEFFPLLGLQPKEIICCLGQRSNYPSTLIHMSWAYKTSQDPVPNNSLQLTTQRKFQWAIWLITGFYTLFFNEKEEK